MKTEAASVEELAGNYESELTPNAWTEQGDYFSPQQIREAFKAGYQAAQNEKIEIQFDRNAIICGRDLGDRELAFVEGARAQFERDKAAIEKAKCLARNPTAFPTAMDYAEHLEKELKIEKERAAKATEALRNNCTCVRGYLCRCCEFIDELSNDQG